MSGQCRKRQEPLQEAVGTAPLVQVLVLEAPSQRGPAGGPGPGAWSPPSLPLRGPSILSPRLPPRTLKGSGPPPPSPPAPAKLSDTPEEREGTPSPEPPTQTAFAFLLRNGHLYRFSSGTELLWSKYCFENKCSGPNLPPPHEEAKGQGRGILRVPQRLILSLFPCDRFYESVRWSTWC